MKDAGICHKFQHFKDKVMLNSKTFEKLIETRIENKKNNIGNQFSQHKGYPVEYSGILSTPRARLKRPQQGISQKIESYTLESIFFMQ